MGESPTSNPLGPSTARLVEPHPEKKPLQEGEFDRFANLTGKLVNVPKHELDGTSGEAG